MLRAYKMSVYNIQYWRICYTTSYITFLVQSSLARFCGFSPHTFVINISMRHLYIHYVAIKNRGKKFIQHLTNFLLNLWAYLIQI